MLPLPRLSPHTEGRRVVSDGSIASNVQSSSFSGRNSDRNDVLLLSSLPPPHSSPSTLPIIIDPRVVKLSYLEGEILPGGETEQIEFKSVFEKQSKLDSSAPKKICKVESIIASKVNRYVVAFLNTCGGAMLFGVEDDGQVNSCTLTDHQKVSITKKIDSVIETIDPQVETGAVTTTFAPVYSNMEEKQQQASSSKPQQQQQQQQRYIIIVQVHPNFSQRQPIYYTDKTTSIAWIRRKESCYHASTALITQREEDWLARGRTVTRTWRHVLRRAQCAFEGYIDTLRQGTTTSSSESTTSSSSSSHRHHHVTRLGLIKSVTLAALNVRDDDDDDDNNINNASDSDSVTGTTPSSSATTTTTTSPSSNTRIVAIVGESGQGKSTLIADLIAGGRSKKKETSSDGWRYLGICGWYFCALATDDSPTTFIRHFAASLYVSPYTKPYRTYVQTSPQEILKICDIRPPIQAMKRLFRLLQGLKGIKRRLAFCIDGIDETPTSAIADLIWSCIPEAPDWLVFIVTARSLPDKIIESSPSSSSSSPHPSIKVIRADGEGAEKDVATFVEARRKSNPKLLSDEMANLISESSGANFQFAFSVLEQLEKHGWGEEEIKQLLSTTAATNNKSTQQDNDVTGSQFTDSLDDKLGRLYVNLFSLQFRTTSELENVQSVLELFLAASRPLCENDLIKILDPDIPPNDVRSALSELRAYLTLELSQSATTKTRATDDDDSEKSSTAFYRLQHLSFQNWLLNRQNDVISCDCSLGHARLAMYHLSQANDIRSRRFLSQHFPSRCANQSTSDVALQQETVHHVLGAAVHLGYFPPLNNSKRSDILRDLSGPGLTEIDNTGRSAIYFAAKRAHKTEYIAALDLLLTASFHLDPSLCLRPARDGRSPLSLAAQRGNAKAVSLMLSNIEQAVRVGFISQEEADAKKESALWAAASSGEVECISVFTGEGQKLSQMLQRGILGYETDDRSKPFPPVVGQGCTALWLAVGRGNLQAARVILEFPPSDCENYPDLGATEHGCAVPCGPLDLAISMGSSEIVRDLAPVSSIDLVGQMRGDRWPTLPLCRACMLGHASCVEELLKAIPTREIENSAEAVINLASDFAPFRTALLEAVWNIQPECVRLLLSDPNIDVLVAEEDGGTALHEAVYWGQGRKSSNRHNANEIVIDLLCHHSKLGLTVDAQDNDGCTPLCFASAANGDQADWVARLIQAGASINVRPRGGVKAKGWQAVVRSAKTTSAQPWGGSPLEEAASRGNVKVVVVLCAAAAGCLSPSNKDVESILKESDRFNDQAKRLVLIFESILSNIVPFEKSTYPVSFFEESMLRDIGGESLATAFTASAASATPLNHMPPKFAVRQTKQVPTRFLQESFDMMNSNNDIEE